MRKKLVAGNWKMHTTPSQSSALSEGIVSSLQGHSSSEVVLCPPYTSLERVGNIIKDTSLSLGAQDLHWEPQSARTGKISADMLRELGVTHVIIGHSEQRGYFHETDITVNKKVKTALNEQLIPIICVGENLPERQRKSLETKISTQVTQALADIGPKQAEICIIAYEPVWAIGTGQSATPEQAQEAHTIIRKLIAKLYDDIKVATAMRILYGGSVNASNAALLFNCPDIDGGLIGGASLKETEFTNIVRACK